MSEKVRYPLSIPKDKKLQLERIANEMGLSMNTIILIAINEYIKKEEGN